MAAQAPIDAVCHVADLHFWRVVFNPLKLANKRFLGNLNVMLRRRRRFITQRAAEFSEAIAATGLEQVLFTGDFTSTGLDAEFALARAFVDGLAARGMAVALTPGNHDVYTRGAHRTRRFERHFAAYAPEGGYPARCALRGGTPLLLVPTTVPNPVTARGLTTPAAIEHVEALLAACPDGPVLVAAHYPLLYRTHEYASNWQHRLRNAGALRHALGESGRRILYVCGHVHRFSYVQDPHYPRLTHLTTGALFRRDAAAGRDGEFSEIHVRADGFGVARWSCTGGAWQREEAALR